MKNVTCVTGLGPSTISENSLAFLCRKLETCLKSHDICNKNASSRHYLPSRIIDVGLDGDSCVCLKDSPVTGPFAPYITLSHRWGSAKVLKLTKMTMEYLKGGFECETLPRTFLHAINVTRMLGVRNLWIDSLCILQD